MLPRGKSDQWRFVSANGASSDPCRADCTLRCGDGVADPGEQCDDGVANNTGGYGTCNPTCTIGAHCTPGGVECHYIIL
jgi:cysteine-rich repeat protein